MKLKVDTSRLAKSAKAYEEDGLTFTPEANKMIGVFAKKLIDAHGKKTVSIAEGRKLDPAFFDLLGDEQIAADLLADSETRELFTSV